MFLPHGEPGRVALPSKPYSKPLLAHIQSSPAATAAAARSRLQEGVHTRSSTRRVWHVPPKAVRLDCKTSCHKSGENPPESFKVRFQKIFEASAKLLATEDGPDDRL